MAFNLELKTSGFLAMNLSAMSAGVTVFAFKEKSQTQQNWGIVIIPSISSKRLCKKPDPPLALTVSTQVGSSDKLDEKNISGSLSDQIVNSALKYRAQAPLLDNLLQEIGLNSGDINKLTSPLLSKVKGTVEPSQKETTEDTSATLLH